MSGKNRILILFFCIMTICLIFCKEKQTITDPTPENPIAVDKENREVRIAARLNRIWCDESVSVHNCVVYVNGIRAPKALFQAYCNHADFFDALVDIGANPGTDMGDNPDSAAVPNGSKFDVSFRWEGAPKSYTLNEFVADSLGRPFEIHMHNGRDRAVRTNMGCILCYTSCNISITSNKNYNWFEKMQMCYPFRPNPTILPADSTLIIIIFRLAD